MRVRMKCTFVLIVWKGSIMYLMISTFRKADADLGITFEENLYCKEFQCFARVIHFPQSSAAKNILNRFWSQCYIHTRKLPHFRKTFLLWFFVVWRTFSIKVLPKKILPSANSVVKTLEQNIFTTSEQALQRTQWLPCQYDQHWQLCCRWRSHHQVWQRTHWCVICSHVTLLSLGGKIRLSSGGSWRSNPLFGG